MYAWRRYKGGREEEAGDLVSGGRVVEVQYVQNALWCIWNYQRLSADILFKI